MGLEREIGFEIDHLDPMGQGVDKQDGKITFIPKTLPGERGQAYVIKKSKGVQFARVLNRSSSSDEREEPKCPHFQQCPGCHYLHTSYAKELEYKKQALKRLLRPLKFDLEKLSVVPAPNRLGYRNRIQLHYRDKVFGFIDAATDELIEVPDCKIFEASLESRFDELYRREQLPSNLPARGHVELYADGEQVRENWNKRYAEGGFTQVNQVMNEYLKRTVQELIAPNHPKHILDLFSGAGNLSEVFVEQGCARTLVDVSPKPEGLDNYHSLNLFAADALKQFEKLKRSFDKPTLLVDPPRKGFASLKDWMSFIQPQQCVYVSCKAATLVRDLKDLPEHFCIDQVILLDLFPATHHFETIVSLKAC